MKQFSSIFILIYLLTSLTVRGDISEQTFLGFWKSQEAAGDTCVLNVKRGGRISCFWVDSASKEVVKGHWEIQENKLIAQWDSGYVDVLIAQGESNVMRQVFQPGQSLDQSPTHESLATKIDPRIPGSLVAKPKKEDSEKAETPDKTIDTFSSTVEKETIEKPDIPARNPFIGYWKIRQNTGGFLGIGSSDSEFFYLNLDRSGKASVSLRNWEAGNAFGSWTVVGNEARITWPSGHKDILRQSGDAVSFASLSPKQDFSASLSNNRKAEHISPAEASQYFSAGEVRMLTTIDIRGEWIEVRNREAKGEEDYLKIEAWGNAIRREKATTTKGKWKLLSNYAIIEWEDGSKDVLRATYRGWTRESFSPGAPTTGRPYRTFYVERSGEK